MPRSRGESTAGRRDGTIQRIKSVYCVSFTTEVLSAAFRIFISLANCIGLCYAYNFQLIFLKHLMQHVAIEMKANDILKIEKTVASRREEIICGNTA